MRFCGQCGSPLNEGQKFCSNCGAKAEIPVTGGFDPAYEQPTMQSPDPNINTPPAYEQPPVQNPYAQPYGASAYGQQSAQNTCGVPAAPAAPRPMKWFKFLIYFLLFAGALINLSFGVNYINGQIYFIQSDGKVTPEQVYSVFGDNLKTLDTVQGVAMIAMAAFSIFVRFRLAKYKSDGPLCLFLLYGIGAAISLTYAIIADSITTLDVLMSGNTIVSLVTSAVVIVLDVIYFNKRKDLFVN